MGTRNVPTLLDNEWERRRLVGNNVLKADGDVGAPIELGIPALQERGPYSALRVYLY